MERKLEITYLDEFNFFKPAKKIIDSQGWWNFENELTLNGINELHVKSVAYSTVVEEHNVIDMTMMS